MIWADEPDDRLLPGREQRQALRAFANQAMSAVASANQLALMRHLAEHDPLTGLRNRRGLQEHIDAEIRAGEGPVAVLVCDLDNFKRINDLLGYASGDEALRRTAVVLRNAPGPRGRVARLGGEEFALVLPGLDEAAAMACAERLRVGIQRASDDFPRPLTASIGVAVSGADADQAAALLRDATRACVGAKRLGRNRCVAYHAEALDALLGSLETRRGGERAARGGDAARRDARRPRRRHRAPLADRRPLRGGDRPRARAAGGPRRAHPRRRRAARHRQARRRRRGAQEARPAHGVASGTRCAAMPSSARGSSRTRTCATSAPGCSRTTSASTAAAIPRAWPARRSRSRRASSPSPTPTRR